MKCINDKSLDDACDKYALKALLRVYKEYNRGCIDSLQRRMLTIAGKYASLQKRTIGELYSKFITSRKNHTAESFYQNMSYWTQDVPIPNGLAHTGKLSLDNIRDFMVVHTFISECQDKLVHTDKADFISIRNCIQRMYKGATGSKMPKGSSKKDVVRGIMGINANFINTAIKAMHMFNDCCPSSVTKFDIIEHTDTTIIDLANRVRENPELYEKLPL